MYKPLADKIRPTELKDVCGQKHILGENRILDRMVKSGAINNMIFYGPPGIGKTTVANIIAKKANKQFYLFFLLTGFLVYNLYLATQIQGLIWLMITFVLVVVSGLSILLYLLSVVFDTSYEISLWNNLKLSFVCLFLHMATFLKLLVGIASILVFTWMMKGLLLFGTFSLLILWCHVAISQEKNVIDRDLAHD